MIALKQFGKLSQGLLARNKQFISITKNYGIWLKDTQYDEHFDPRAKGLVPDPYPKTEEERVKAAEKYGLHPDEYKPFPPDHRYSGDYPDLPWLGVETRDPYYPWDYPTSRRNHGEAMHKSFDMLGEDRYAYGVREFVDDHTGACIFLAISAFAISLFVLSPDTSQPEMDRQYPGEGEHYTFELSK